MNTVTPTQEQYEALVEVISDIINKVEPITFEELLKFQSQGD